MPILDLEQRARELGRIRMGQVVAAGEKVRPEKLDRFRLTSPSEQLLVEVAMRYGGHVEAWDPQGGGPRQWQVLIEAPRLPVMLPPDPVSQHLEAWSGGGCVRRCDGVTETTRGSQPCLCGPDVATRLCKPTTRLNVVLHELRGLGCWRLETHGYYAATEIPGVAALLARAGGYVEAWLGLEERVIRRPGEKAKRFMVPTLEVDISPAELMAGHRGTAPTIGSGRHEQMISPRSEPLAIEAGSTREVESFEVEALPAADDYERFHEDLAQAVSVEETRAVYVAAVAAGVLGEHSPATTERERLHAAIAAHGRRLAELEGP